MADARTVELVSGIETTLAVDKAGGETPVYLIVGCATDISMSGETELITAKCYSGTEVAPSGDDPAYTFTINGLVKEYNATNDPNNVSANDLEDWFLAKTLKKFRYARPKIGDRVRSFDGFVTSFSESGTVDGSQTYSATVTPLKKPVITSVVA
ncbi:hypothetical protein [Dyadobacter sandarakinus]|uniref:Phage tail tube protein n=1 Tax=Dyadobacter sandarakinus TaxID=2747268 RepID=A0ABX7I0Y6_9BACT|nr:hypothetical protein [Dyadobacter sandarakinus]QRQ99716.1 hypothetical protein HWI92_01690 [Dyadobacter sandarakinus]